jgi:hypothetical protein
VAEDQSPWSLTTRWCSCSSVRWRGGWGTNQFGRETYASTELTEEGNGGGALLHPPWGGSLWCLRLAKCGHRREREWLGTFWAERRSHEQKREKGVPMEFYSGGLSDVTLVSVLCAWRGGRARDRWRDHTRGQVATTTWARWRWQRRAVGGARQKDRATDRWAQTAVAWDLGPWASLRSGERLGSWQVGPDSLNNFLKIQVLFKLDLIQIGASWARKISIKILVDSVWREEQFLLLHISHIWIKIQGKQKLLKHSRIKFEYLDVLEEYETWP